MMANARAIMQGNKRAGENMNARESTAALTMAGTLEQRRSQVEEQMQRLVTAIERMGSLSAAVEGRIQQILMPATPNGIPENVLASPVSVPLAQELEALTDRVDRIANGVDDMLARIEL